MYTYTDPRQVYHHDLTDNEVAAMLEFCLTEIQLIKYEFTDVSDVSYNYDVIHHFTFRTEGDAIVFRLKFK